MAANSIPKLLIVDDKEENLKVLEKLLKPLRAEVYQANSGNAALQMMLEHEFMLVLLDVQMPNMDGYEVLETMSWEEKTRSIPVIFITANYADEQHKLKGYQSGAVDYLYKPINEIILLSKVNVFLELYEQKNQLQQVTERYQLILNAAGEGIFGTDLKGNITFVNPAAEKILKFSAGSLVNQPIDALIINSNQEAAISIDTILKACQTNGKFHNSDARFLRQDTSPLPVEFTAAPIHDQEEQHTGLVFVFSDITSRKTAEQQLTHLALYDHLTKLPNRLLFEKIISQSLARARRHNHLMAVMFLDLDHFKDVNDRLGHDVGDLLLKSVADRLVSCVRETDNVARLGGDEFAIVLDKITNSEDAAMISEKVIAILAPPFVIGENDVFISTSIGIAVYPISGESASTLTKNADIAMYQAKQTGRNQYCFFTDIMNEQIRFRLEMVHNLRYAIEKRELALYYQPKLDLKTNTIAGVEALLRWNHPTLGLLVPADFLQIAEETSIIPQIGEWVLQEACRIIKKCHETNLFPGSIAVNLSSLQILQDDVFDIIQNSLLEAQLAPEYLEIELTETSLIASTGKSAAVLEKLNHLGVKISIDDFGTGYSSLYYLKKLPVSALKIDKSFVNDMTRDPNDAAIVKAVIALAHNLDLNVIAEGVETTEQLAFLKENNCDQIQGFLFTPPLDEEDLMKLLENKTVLL